MNKVFCLFLMVTGVLGLTSAQASLVWTGNVSSVWNTSDNNWLNGGIPASYVDGTSDVVFDNTALTTNINIAATVSPNSILISNTFLKNLLFTNAVISGAGGILKTNSGLVYFGSDITNACVYSNSLSFSGGTVIKQGKVLYLVETNSAIPGPFASGGSPVWFGTGSITLDGPSAFFSYRLRFGSSGITVLTNSFIIGSGGGTIDVERATVTLGGAAAKF